MRSLTIFWIALVFSVIILMPTQAVSATIEHPHVDIAALLERDELLSGKTSTTIEPFLYGQHWAELNGRAPAELILDIRCQLKDGATIDYWQRQLYFYDCSQPDNPLPLSGGPIDLSESMVHGYLEICDLNEDGREEVVSVINTMGIYEDLHIYEWRSTGFRDILWRRVAGAAFVIFDLDGDGRKEIVVFKGIFWENGLSGPLTMLVLDEHGFLKETKIGDRYNSRLPALLDHLLSGIDSHAPLDELQHLKMIMIHQQQAPADMAAYQRSLEKLYERLNDPSDRAKALKAMIWPGNDKALPFLYDKWATEQNQSIIVATIEGLAALGTEEDRFRIVDRFTTLSLPLTDEMLEYNRALLRGLEVSDDQQLLMRLRQLLAEEAYPWEIRQQYLENVTRNEPSAGKLVLDIIENETDGKLRATAADAMAYEISYMMENKSALRKNLPMDRLLPLLEDPHPTVRRAAALTIGILCYRDAAPFLAARLKIESDFEVRCTLIYELGNMKAFEYKSDLLALLKKKKNGETPIPLLYGLFMLEEYEAIIPFLAQAFDRATERGQISSLIIIGTRLHNPKAARIVLEHMIESELWSNRYILEEFGTISGYYLWKPAAENIARFTNLTYSPSTRESACKILGYLKMPISRDTLRRVLREDEDINVRAVAALGLGRLHDSDSRETIMAYLQAESFANNDFAMALAYLGDKQSIRFLREHALQPGEDQRNNPAVLEALALGRSGANRGVGPFFMELFEKKRARNDVPKRELIDLTIWMIKAEASEFNKAFEIIRDDPAYRAEFTDALPEILKALGKFGGKKDLPLVQSYLNHDSFNTRNAADAAEYSIRDRVKESSE